MDAVQDHAVTVTPPLGVIAPVLPTHERWFVESQQAGDWSFFLSPLPLVLTAAVVALTVTWRVVAMRVEGRGFRAGVPPAARPAGALGPPAARHPPRRRAPRAGRDECVHHAVQDHLEGVGGDALLLVEAALGIWLVTGFKLRPPAALVLGLGPALALVAGGTALGECANLAAVAAFLVVVPPG